MTPKQEAVKKRFLDYGFIRHCYCYHGQCLVIPESLVDEMVKRIAKVLEGKDKNLQDILSREKERSKKP